MDQIFTISLWIDLGILNANSVTIGHWVGSRDVYCCALIYLIFLPPFCFWLIFSLFLSEFTSCSFCNSCKPITLNPSTISPFIDRLLLCAAWRGLCVPHERTYRRSVLSLISSGGVQHLTSLERDKASYWQGHLRYPEAWAGKLLQWKSHILDICRAAGTCTVGIKLEVS